MNTLRRRLRLWVTAWLLFQVASLSALVPRDCCAAHRPAGKEHHGHSSDASRCPMRGADRTPCPMHRGHGQHAGHGEPAPAAHDHGSPDGRDQGAPAAPDRGPATPCVRGTCAGPMSALLALLSNVGILPEPAASLPHVTTTPVTTVAREQLVRHVDPPDPPPPRS